MLLLCLYEGMAFMFGVNLINMLFAKHVFITLTLGLDWQKAKTQTEVR